MNPLLVNIDRATVDNEDYRHTIYTGKMQLVLMNLLPGEEIGFESHKGIDQFFRIEKGIATVIIGDKSAKVKKDDAFVIPAGTTHNVINHSKRQDCKLYTIYSSPTHPPHTVEISKEQGHKH